MIALNGMPFVIPCLRAVYEFAHEILVVEGAVQAAADQATSDGHSIDGTLDALRSFPDPQDKLKLFTRDGFWSEKDEMCNEYIHHCTGDYIWQIDCDEFYQPDDIAAIVEMLRNQPDTTSVSFQPITFFGGFDTVAVGGRRDEPYQRIKKYYPGAHYLTHRPPTVLTPSGERMRDIHELHAYDLARRGIFMYHYAYVLADQVRRKVEYYDTGVAGPAGNADLSTWADDVFLRLGKPLQTDIDAGKPSWLQRFTGTHPPEIAELVERVKLGTEQVGGAPIELPPQGPLRALVDDAHYQRFTARARRLNELHRACILMVEWSKSMRTKTTWKRASRAAGQIGRSIAAGNVLGVLPMLAWWMWLFGAALWARACHRVHIGGALSVLVKKWLAWRTHRLARAWERSKRE